MKVFKSELFKNWLIFLFVGFVVISILVQWEQPSKIWDRGPRNGKLAVVIHHPNIYGDFIGDLAGAAAGFLLSNGWRVVQTNISSETALPLEDAELIIIGTNTFFWHPDFPTLNFISQNKNRLDGKNILGFVGGAGATERAERIFSERLLANNPRTLKTKSFWILRPNDETRLAEENKKVALEQAVLLTKGTIGQ